MSKRPPLISVPVIGYGEVSKTPVIATVSGKQLQVFSVTAHNRSGGAIDVGLAVKLAAGSWKYGTLTAASTPDFLDATDAIQAGTSTSVFTTTNNSGFLVQADRKFGMIGLTVSAAGAGGTFTYKYYNGSTYATLTTIAVPADYSATGDKIIAFAAPHDWAPGSTAGVGGFDGMYSIQVLATGAPGSAVSATAAWVSQFMAFREAVADNGALSLAFSDVRVFLLESGEAIVPYFGTASAANTVEGFYSLSD